MPSYKARAVQRPWGLFRGSELLASVRAEADVVAMRRFRDAGLLEGDVYIAELLEPEPGVTQVPDWVREQSESGT